MLRLGDLLGEKALGLVLRTGPPDAAERPVYGAAVVEVESPSRWIANEWVLLTAGVRLEGCPDDDLRALVAECDKTRVAAIAFGIGPVFEWYLAPARPVGAARRGFVRRGRPAGGWGRVPVLPNGAEPAGPG